MSFIKRLALALCLASCFSAYYNLALAEDTTGNVATGTWSGATTGTINDCCSGGSQPIVTPDGTVHFGYMQSTVTQSIAVNQALQAAGSPVSVTGYNYGWNWTNADYQRGSLSGAINTINSSGISVHQYTWTGGPTGPNGDSVNGSVTYNNPYLSTDLSSINISFTGRDDRGWAGYYGPTVSNVSLSIRYNADACVIDPLSSTSCPGYQKAYTDLQCQSNPLYDTTCPGYAQAYFDQQCSLNPLYNNACPGYAEAYKALQCSLNPLYDQTCPSYASVITGPNIASGTSPVNIATALSHSGTGITIYGFNYGFEWRRLSGKCYDSFLFFCTDYRTWSNVKPNLQITDAQGNTILSKSWNFSGDGNYNGGNWNSVSGSTIFYGTSYNSLNLGYADWDAGTSNVGSVRNYFLKPLMAPDQCAIDPLSNTACSGYAAAFLAFQCNISSLYSPECPGYTEALQKMLDEQAVLAMAATSSSTTTDPIASANTGSTSASSAAATGTQDPTKTDATVTTDVGGVELTTTGEIVVADSVPAAVKEVAKETTKTPEAAKETTTASSTSTTATEKKTTKVNALAIAQSAAREAEATAKATAEAAVAQSQSAAANPSDGTGATVNLGGITLDSLRSMTTAGQNSAVTSAVNRAAQQAVAVRSLSADPEAKANTDDDRPVAVATADPLQDTVNRTVSAINYSLIPQQTDEQVEDRSKSNTGSGMRLEQMAVMPAIPEEPKAPTGPSVRRGGAVDGMSGGDINALAAAPANFNDYLGRQLQDAQFYAAKEIYRGQRNVDNARALRGLGTDRLHQQMVDQQYNISGQ